MFFHAQDVDMLELELLLGDDCLENLSQFRFAITRPECLLSVTEW